MNRYKKILMLCVLMVFTLILSACGTKSLRSHQLVTTFASANNIYLPVDFQVDDEELNEIKTELSNELISLDMKFNIQTDRYGGHVSDLKRINDNSGVGPVEVDPEVIHVIKLANSVSKETGDFLDDFAVYDITISPIWDIWDFTNKSTSGRYQIPSKEQIGKLLPLVDYNSIIIDEEKNTVFLPRKGMAIDLGSIVKGYAADKLKDILLARGIEQAVIDVGRNIHTLGGSFEIGLSTPYHSLFHEKFKDLPQEKVFEIYDKTAIFGKLDLKDKTAVTSGTYEKYFYGPDGDPYHHIIDPRTGYPIVNDVVAVTVVTDESIKGDAYSTALFSLGMEKGMELVNSKEGLDAIWVIENRGIYEVYISSGLERIFEFNKSVEQIDFVYKGVYK